MNMDIDFLIQLKDIAIVISAAVFITLGFCIKTKNEPDET